jgi:hypothetical protein
MIYASMPVPYHTDWSLRKHGQPTEVSFQLCFAFGGLGEVVNINSCFSSKYAGVLVFF